METPLGTAIAAYLQECFARRSPPRVDELALRVGMHPVTLRRRVKQLFGVTACRYLKEQQVRFACELLQGGIPVAEIVRHAGFGNARSFFRAFRRELRQTPRAYQGEFESVTGRISVPDGH